MTSRSRLDVLSCTNKLYFLIFSPPPPSNGYYAIIVIQYMHVLTLVYQGKINMYYNNN